MKARGLPSRANSLTERLRVGNARGCFGNTQTSVPGAERSWGASEGGCREARCGSLNMNREV